MGFKNVLQTRCTGSVARLKSMKGVSTNNRTYIILHNPVLVLFVINLHFELILSLNYLLRISSAECAQGHG